MKLKLIGIFILAAFSACRPDPADVIAGNNNPDWTEASHGNASPNYSTVFPQDQVNELEITIGADNWSAIRANMKSLFGYDFGARPGDQASTNCHFASISTNSKTFNQA